MNTNLIKETIIEIKSHGLTEDDVLWVGSRDGEYAISWEDFINKFKNIEYYKGFGYQEIAQDLVVVGKDWWLERYEYDGSEEWEIKKIPVKAYNPKPFNKIKGCWHSIKIIMEK